MNYFLAHYFKVCDLVHSIFRTDFGIIISIKNKKLNLIIDATFDRYTVVVPTIEYFSITHNNSLNRQLAIHKKGCPAIHQ
jgi:hypothetical protein